MEPRPRFLADAMLGDIARWLRILGEDCLYADPAWSDEEVRKAARPEDRIIVTRDTELVNAARREALRAIEVPQAPTEEVLEEVYRGTGLLPDPERMTTRCSLCNGRLEKTDEVGARKAADIVRPETPLERVFARHDTFWVCIACGQLYWRGTHWDEIARVRQRLEERLR
ncbi:MAG: Mut7-C RNAse domain-containing protein [Euryarchaeota archaeon]|nr:Mut7-C RNAse domain-containing protein [Euryarchaeota archaeon]